MHDGIDTRMIEIRNLSKFFNGSAGVPIKAVDGVNLDVLKGEVVIINGPNGSGKTTLLTLLGCMSRPSSGALSVNNTDVLKLSQRELTRFRLKNIGFIFQTFRLIDALTIKENVELIFHIAETNHRDTPRIISSLMEEVEISHRAAFFPSQLSGGEKQRVAIARALANSPTLILADEPTGSLDSKSGQNIVQLLKSLAKERETTVIIVSHDERIHHFADRVIRMEDGKISTNDSHDEIILT